MNERYEEERKPWRGFGMCPNATDGNGNVQRVTEKQCLAMLRKWMRKQPKPLRCKNMYIVDRGEYWKWSAC